MKPNFALNITDTSIGLLHRTSGGWMPIGDTRFDSPDLEEALGYLRASALGLSPHGITTKLVLPPSQVLYTELEAPGPDKAKRQEQIRTGLEGKTPYDVDDLVFDWSGKGSVVKVAVVARETLEEAEAFAVQHKLNPVSFVTIPGEDQFRGEPWFGITKASAELLPDGENVSRDQKPIVIASREGPKSDAKSTETEQEKAQDAEPATKATTTAEDAAKPEEDAAKLKAEANAAAEKARAEAAAEAERIAKEAEETARIAAEAETAAKIEAANERAKAEAESRALTMAKAEAKRIATEAEKTRAAMAETDRAREGADRVKAALIKAEQSRASTTELDDEEAAGNAGLSSADAPTFASRRREDVPAGPAIGPASKESSGDAAPKITGVDSSRPDVTPVISKANTNSPDFARQSNSKSPIIARRADEPPAGTTTSFGSTAPSSTAMPLPKASVGARTSPSTAKSIDADASMGSFGAKLNRQPGKPRFLGLILTIVLLAFLALVAAWSSFYISKNQTVEDPILQAALPVEEQLSTTSEAELLADVAPEAQEDAEIVLDPGNVAAEVSELVAGAAPEPLAPDVQTQAMGDEVPLTEPDEAEPVAAIPAEAEPEAEEPVVVEQAAATPPAEVQGPPPPSVGQDQAAARAAGPGRGEQDEIFLATMDGPPPAFDAVALPAVPTAPDAAPGIAMPPPPFGTLYQFDEDGRIKPTPEGVVTPEGVRLVAARPNIEPPPRPAAISDPAPVALPTTPEIGVTPDATASATTPVSPTSESETTFAADPSVVSRRPRGRPADIAPGQAQDDTSLTEPQDTRLTSLRPRVRPNSVVEQAEAARKTREAASLAATAVAAEKNAARANGSVLAVAYSLRPAARPRDFSRAVSAAVAAATRKQSVPATVEEPEEAREPEVKVLASAAPRIPTRASVAKQATFKNAINLSKINLIGIYGTANNRYALVRSSSGRYKKVKVGDRVDGGTVAAITQKGLRYKKGRKMLDLSMPKG